METSIKTIPYLVFLYIFIRTTSGSKLLPSTSSSLLSLPPLHWLEFRLDSNRWSQEPSESSNYPLLHPPNMETSIKTIPYLFLYLFIRTTSCSKLLPSTIAAPWCHSTSLTWISTRWCLLARTSKSSNYPLSQLHPPNLETSSKTIPYLFLYLFIRTTNGSELLPSTSSLVSLHFIDLNFGLIDVWGQEPRESSNYPSLHPPNMSWELVLRDSSRACPIAKTEDGLPRGGSVVHRYEYKKKGA
jgi:hypothetical protein